jgi:hypothetical protein
LVATVRPGEYAREVCRLHDEEQRIADEDALQVLASVALWQQKMEKPTCLDEAKIVLRAFYQQAGADLDNALNPHAAVAIKALLMQNTGETADTADPVRLRRARTRPAVSAERLSGHG